MSALVRQKLGTILENQVVEKLKSKKNVFNEKWSPKLIFLNEKINKKLSFGTFWQTVIHKIKWFPLRILIFGQKPKKDPPSLKFHNQTDFKLSKWYFTHCVQKVSPQVWIINVHKLMFGKGLV